MRRIGKSRSRTLRISVLALFAGFILAGCDIAITQTASSGQVTVGEEITYTISGSDLDNDEQIQNPTPPGEPPIPKEGEGYSALIGEANLPEGVAFVSAKPTNTADGSFCARPDANRVVRCFLPFRKDSESNRVNITVRATEPGMKTTTTSVFDEYLEFATGTEYPVVVRRTDSGTEATVQIRVDPETGLFLDPDVGRPITNDRNPSNNAASATTEVLPDTTAPKVAATKPANKATGVRRGAPLTATFSEAMEVTTVNGSTFELFKVTRSGAKKVANVTVGLSDDGLRATLDPFGTSSTLLSKNAKYKAVVTTGAKDVAGNALDQDPRKAGAQQKAWTFTTGRR